MFENLSKGLNAIFTKIKGRAYISDADLSEALRQIRISLFEADVALPVVNEFIKEIKDKALGAEVIKSIKPGQMIVKIIHDEMIKILGGIDEKPKIELKSHKTLILSTIIIQSRNSL